MRPARGFSDRGGQRVPGRLRCRGVRPPRARYPRGAERWVRLRVQHRGGGRWCAVCAAAQSRCEDRAAGPAGACGSPRARRVDRPGRPAHPRRGRQARLEPAPLPAAAVNLRAGTLPPSGCSPRHLDGRDDPRRHDVRAASDAGLAVGRVHAHPTHGAASGSAASTRASSSTRRTPTSAGACGRRVGASASSPPPLPATRAADRRRVIAPNGFLHAAACTTRASTMDVRLRRFMPPASGCAP